MAAVPTILAAADPLILVPITDVRKSSLNNQDLSRAFESQIELRRTPVALAFVEVAPEGIPQSSVIAPSACSYWRLGERGVFYAPADRHMECAVGAMTMGFDLPESRQPEAAALVGTMVQLDYFGQEEATRLPSVAKPHSGIVYGPLSQFPLPPDLVIFALTPVQAMLLAEATGDVALTGEGLTALGRPACAAVASAANAGKPRLSLGCIGARTYLGLDADLALLVIPALELELAANRLATLAHANRELAAFHQGQQARFPVEAF